MVRKTVPRHARRGDRLRPARLLGRARPGTTAASRPRRTATCSPPRASRRWSKRSSGWIRPGTPLKIGLFLDTSILNNEDLTSERGKQIFYATIRDYYSRIPPRYWAAIDNRPVVWLYDAQKVSAFDQSTFDYVYDHFAQDFGGLRPWIVREWQWYAAKNTGTD